MSELQKFMTTVGQWADKQFGNAKNPLPPAHHLKREVKELIEALQEDKPVDEVNLEIADCFTLILHIARRWGMDADDLLKAGWKKHHICLAREWGEPDADGVVEHVKKQSP